MRVTFDPIARDELNRIFAWIAKDNPRAAYQLIARIEVKVMRLATPELTHMGRPGLVEGTRELLEWPYIIVYKVYDGRNEIVILRSCMGRKIGKPAKRDRWHRQSTLKRDRFAEVASALEGGVRTTAGTRKQRRL
jgi:toxin ParE1/3/4